MSFEVRPASGDSGKGDETDAALGVVGLDGGDGPDGFGISFSEKYFPALRQPNFRRFWLGQCVSLVGTWMQNVGQSWLVLELTGSPLKLGLVSALQFLPMMLLSVFAGALADRFPKRRTIIFTQAALMCLALTLSLLTATGLVRYWMILVLALILGLVNTIDVPTRQSFIIELTGRDALMNAVSLNSAAFNLARMIGPAVAGLFMAAMGPAICFLLNGLSFGAVILALLRVNAGKPPEAQGPFSAREVLASVREGLSYIRSRRDIVFPMAMLSAISAVVINYNVFVPTFARGPLGRDAVGYGFLMTCIGAGSLVAALSLAVKSRKGPSVFRRYGGAVGMCVALAACGLQRSWVGSCILLAVLGFCTISFTASTNATVQLATEDRYRGRVMSVYALVFAGVTPIGGLYSGALSDALGPGTAMTISGGIGLTAVLLIGLAARRVSMRKKDAVGPSAAPAQAGGS